MNIVTIMDFPDDEKYNAMCMIWMRRVQRHAPGAHVRILTSGGLPRCVREYFDSFPDVTVQKAMRRNIGEFDHFNLAIKLFNLSHITEPFIFLDADMFVLSDLDFLWKRRNDKPFIGVYDPILAGHESAACRKLNSGLQIVSNTSFYNYDAIVECSRRDGHRSALKGDDQMLLSGYFRSIGYDFSHPEIGAGWNSCSRYTRLFKNAQGEWTGMTRDKPGGPDVHAHIVHYWNGACRPWNMDCPLFAEEVSLLRSEHVDMEPASRTLVTSSDAVPRLRVHVLNAASDVLDGPGEHPFSPTRGTTVERVDSANDADVIFWHLDLSSPGADYDRLVGRNAAFFKANQERFVMYSTVRNPGWFYLNNAVCFTPHPCFGREKNRLSRVFCVPHMFDCTDFNVLADKTFISQLRCEAKKYDLSFAASLGGLVNSGLESGCETVKALDMDRKKLLSLSSEERSDVMRKNLREIAGSKYYVHVEGDSISPMLLYHAMMLGTIPVIVGMPDLPFSEAIAWHECALFPVAGQTLSKLLAVSEANYASRRLKAMEVWRDYCEPSACNEQIITRYLSPLVRLERQETISQAQLPV